MKAHNTPFTMDPSSHGTPYDQHCPGCQSDAEAEQEYDAYGRDCDGYRRDEGHCRHGKVDACDQCDELMGDDHDIAMTRPHPIIHRTRHCDRCGHVIHGAEATQGRCRYCQRVATAQTDLVIVTVMDVASGDTRRYGFATAVDAITWCEADMDAIETACRARGWRCKRPVTRYHLHANGTRVAILALSDTGKRYRATTGVTVQRDANGEVVTWSA